MKKATEKVAKAVGITSPNLIKLTADGKGRAFHLENQIFAKIGVYVFKEVRYLVKLYHIFDVFI